MRRLIDRLAREQYRALNDLRQGLTVSKRFGGLNRSNRNEAKWLILSFVPVIPLMVSDGLNFERGIIWNAWAVFAAVWFVSVVGTGLFVMIKAFARSVKKNG